MKRFNHKAKIIASAFLVLLLTTFGCKDLFNNPLVDKETGEDLTLLLLDMNIFKTKFTVHLVDQKTGSYVVDKDIKVLFSGDQVGKIVDFGGKTKTDFTTKSGRLDLALDPNYEFSESNPFFFRVNVLVEDRSYFAFPAEVTLTKTGEYDVVVNLIELSTNKSLVLNPGSEPFDIKFNDAALGSDWYYIDYGNAFGPYNSNGKYYHGYFFPWPLSISGTLTATNFTEDLSLFENWGIEGSVWGQSYVEFSKGVQLNYSFNASDWYSVTKRNNQTKCVSGINIKVSEEFNQAGTARFNYSVWANNEKVHGGLIGGSVMPFTTNTGAFYHPTNASSVVVKISGDEQYNVEPSEITVSNFCGATVNFTAKAKSGLVPYQVVVTATCPGTPIGAAPSISGQYRLKGSTGQWTQFSFVGGTCTLKLKPGETYTVQGFMDNQTATFDLPTNESNINAVIQQTLREVEELKEMKVTFSDIPTGKQIKIDLIFKEGNCPF